MRNPSNIMLFLKKAFLLVIKRLPAKAFIIKVLAFPAGALSMVKNYKQWPGILTFFKKTSVSARPNLSNLVRYFSEQVKQRLWTAVFFEANGDFRGSVKIGNKDLLNYATDTNRGAIFLGAHYGPQVLVSLLRHRRIDIRPVLSERSHIGYQAISKRNTKFLLSRRLLFFVDQLNPLVGGKSELECVRYLQRGGNVTMLIDFPRTAPGGTDTRFFDLPMKLNHFPFKLALKYDLPIILFCFTPNKNNGYDLRLAECKPFLTPEEGVSEYVCFFEKQIASFPYAWVNATRFSQWQINSKKGPLFSAQSLPID